jgi:two-component system sensor histidine kinase TctE
MPEAKRLNKWPRGPFASLASESAPKSLFLEILDWMLAPLLLLWPLSIFVTNHYAHVIANLPFDGALVEVVLVVSEFAEGLETTKPVSLSKELQIALAGDGDDSREYRISRSPRLAIDLPAALDSEFTLEVFGASGPRSKSQPLVEPSEFDLQSAEIPIPDRRPVVVIRNVGLRDDEFNSEPVRVASKEVKTRSGDVLLVQVAETRNKREALVARIIRGVLLPQFAIIPIAVILSYLGLSRGLAPLRNLRNTILARRSGDLSPLPVSESPEEVRPLLVALNEMMARLETNLQAQQRFIADAAHQLRTPLTGLKTQADLLCDENDPVRLRRSMRMISESADRAAHMTKQLLTLARTEASHEKAHRFELVDMRVLARATSLEWAEAAVAKDIDLSFECDERPHMTEGVPLLLREMLANLVDNAIKYTPRGGRVTVRVRSLDFVVIEIEDDGPGIPASERGKVFERFYRILGSTEDGSGLGLPIVKEIADLHRSRLELLAGDLGGCLFRISMTRRGGFANPLDLRPD